MRPAVLMTDPRHFAIKGGANPHTRRADNSLKVVRMEAAWPQWHAYIDRLRERGVDVYIIDAAPELTGMVFAANAGFLQGRLEDVAPAEKTFFPSHFTAAHRIGESARFADFMQNFGFTLADYPADWRFEGEADAFPVGRGEELQWVFTWGFRSDPQVADWLQEKVVRDSVARFKLTDPRYYHGDCLLCDLGGPALAWTSGMDAQSVQKLRETFSGCLVEMSDADAAEFVGNSFYVETAQGRILFTSAGISSALRARVELEGIEVVPVDVSEFFGKGGGGPKCMVFNLGEVDADDPRLTPAQRAFRHSRRVEVLRQTRWADTLG